MIIRGTDTSKRWSYNEILAVYKAKVDKIKELDKHFSGEDRYSLTGKQLHECRDGIKKFAKALEVLVHTFVNDFNVRSELKRQFSENGDARQTADQFRAYSKLMRSFGDFHVLKEEEEKEEERKTELEDEEVAAFWQEDIVDPPLWHDIVVDDSNRGSVIAGIAAVTVVAGAVVLLNR